MTNKEMFERYRPLQEVGVMAMAGGAAGVITVGALIRKAVAKSQEVGGHCLRIQDKLQRHRCKTRAQNEIIANFRRVRAECSKMPKPEQRVKCMKQLDKRIAKHSEKARKMMTKHVKSASARQFSGWDDSSE